MRYAKGKDNDPRLYLEQALGANYDYQDAKYALEASKKLKIISELPMNVISNNIINKGNLSLKIMYNLHIH